MRYRVALWSSLALAFSLTLVASPVSAGLDSWHFGSAFNVGGVFFRIGYAEAGPFGSSFYFEAAKPFRYSGYACSSYCYRQGPRYYHHPSCSALHHHLGRYGYAPGHYIEHYGPPIAYPPPHYFYRPPRWQVRYYGHYRQDDHHHGDRHYRQRHHRGRHNRHGHDRHGHDRHH